MAKFLVNIILSVFPLFLGTLYADLITDLEEVEKIDKKQQEKLLLVRNFQGQGGYMAMPSARLLQAGEIGFGFSYLPPYSLYHALFSLFDHVELTANYWIFQGTQESNFGHLGFGEDADRSVNVRIALLRKEDGLPALPEFALGFNDFLGTKRFYSFYVVATQTIVSKEVELSVGWGKGRIHGWFAALAWSPLRRLGNWGKNLSLCVEYDANRYATHPQEHFRGREVKSPLNIGVQASFYDLFQFSCSTIRGCDIAGSASLHYNFGTSAGLFPKIYDPLLHTTPLDRQAIGELRSKEMLGQELAYAFREQGLDLEQARWIAGKKEGLWIRVINVRYREKEVVRARIESALSSLIPSQLQQVQVVLETEGIPVEQYTYQSKDLLRWREGLLGDYELNLISPAKEVTPPPKEALLLYQKKKKIGVITFHPLFQSYFGSATGKFKYDVGLIGSAQGYLWADLYYQLIASYVMKSSSQDIGSVDRLNPSQLLHVRSDAILYRQTNSFHVDQAYLQKSWNWGRGWFSRVSLGYFETAYAGVGIEGLYYPVQTHWAIGVEGAYLYKRKYSGLGFQNKVRTLQGFIPKKVHYRGIQYFFDFYYRYAPLSIETKISLGQFLAKDRGAKIELSRCFPSGMKISSWCTFTTAVDKINQKRYFDKGICLSFPLDMFMNRSSKSYIHYAMSAWLRDIGAKAETGKPLYPLISEERCP